MHKFVEGLHRQANIVVRAMKYFEAHRVLLIHSVHLSTFYSVLSK